MNVLYLNSALGGHDPGPAGHGWALVNGLRDLGLTVQVFPSKGRGSPAGISARFKPGPRLRETLAVARGITNTVLQTVAVCRERPRVDVILARHFDYELQPILLSWLLSAPLVLEVNAPHYIERTLDGRPSWPLLRFLEGFQWCRADRVYAVSQPLRTLLIERHGVDPDRVAAIPNGVDLTRFVTVAEHDGPHVRIVFVGGFYRWHGVAELVTAVAPILRADPETELVLVGSGPEEETIRRLVDTLGLGEQVSILGRVPEREMPSLLATCQIGVAPYQEVKPFYFSPLKVFEYMAAGLAVVATSQGQIGELLPAGSGLTVSPGDIDALTSALRLVADNAHLRRSMGAEARRHVERSYTWLRTCEQLAAVVRSVVAARVTPPGGDRPSPCVE